MDFIHSLDFDAITNSVIFKISVRIIFLLIFLKLAHFIIDKVSQKVITKVEDGEHSKQIETVKIVIVSVTDIVLIGLFLLGILNLVGVDIRPFLTAAGVVGLAVGIGAKKFVEDIIGGILFILEGQVRVGDVVEINGKSGTVEKLNLKVVVLRDAEGRVHYIRNGMIDIVTNCTRDYGYYVLTLGVGYKENVDYVMQTIRQVFDEQLKTNHHYATKIIGKIDIQGLDSFGDSAVNIRVRIKTKPSFKSEVGREFNRLIKNKFDELGIEIPFPQTTVHFANDSKNLSE